MSFEKQQLQPGETIVVAARPHWITLMVPILVLLLSVIVSIVLNLPTSGPVLLNSLLTQDMYVAAGFILMLSALTVLGTFISDVLLVFLDPRIRLE